MNMTLLVLNLALEALCLGLLLSRVKITSLRLLVAYVFLFDLCVLAGNNFWDTTAYSYAYWAAHSATYCFQMALAWELCLKSGHRHAPRLAGVFAGVLSFFLVTGIFDTWLRKPHAQMALSLYAGSAACIVLFLAWLLSNDFKTWPYRWVWYGLTTWALGEALFSIEARVFALFYPALSLLALAIFTYAAWRTAPVKKELGMKTASPSPGLLRQKAEAIS